MSLTSKTLSQQHDKEEWSIPLVSSLNDLTWEDNSWIVGHLRQLADKIEKQNPRIVKIGLDIGVGYPHPNLTLEVYLTK